MPTFWPNGIDHWDMMTTTDSNGEVHCCVFWLKSCVAFLREIEHGKGVFMPSQHPK